MVSELWLILGGIAAALGALWVAFTRGKKAQRHKDQAENVEAVEKVNEVDRDVDREPDPVKRLRDKWQR